MFNLGFLKKKKVEPTPHRLLKHILNDIDELPTDHVDITIVVEDDLRHNFHSTKDIRMIEPELLERYVGEYSTINDASGGDVCYIHITLLGADYFENTNS